MKVSRLGYGTRVMPWPDKVSAFSTGRLFCVHGTQRKARVQNRTNGAVVIAISDPPPEKILTLKLTEAQFVAFHAAAWLAADGDVNAWCLQWLRSGARTDLQDGTIELLEGLE